MVVSFEIREGGMKHFPARHDHNVDTGRLEPFRHRHRAMAVRVGLDDGDDAGGPVFFIEQHAQRRDIGRESLEIDAGDGLANHTWENN